MFAYAKLSGFDFGAFRILGDGLGNLLFPWARSVVGAHKCNFSLIWPTWIQIKFGPILRRERDKRVYHRLFVANDKYISGSKKLIYLAINPRISESDYYQNKINYNSNSIIVFRGMDGYFSEILKDHKLVKQELLNIVQKDHVVGIKDYSGSITVHVRLGDFSYPQKQSDLDIKYSGHTNFRLPFGWYIDVIKKLRKKLGEEYKVYVFSDGRDDELAEFLSLPNCTRLGFGPSIADLLAISSSHVLLASGSTFSMWASYLGRMPVVWYPGQLRQRLYYERPDAEIELKQGQDVPDSFIKMIATNNIL